jgi:hypothetical protein
MSYIRKVKSRSYSFSSPAGGSGVFYAAGFYRAPASDVSLTQASPTGTIGQVNEPHAAHPFIVAAGAGSVDAGQVGLRVSGTKIDDTGTRTPSFVEVITDDITTLSTNQYLEGAKYLGEVTYELYVVSGAPTTYSLTFNYGLAAYADFWNTNFLVTRFNVQGRAGANDSSFDIELLHHKTTGWTYSAAAFEPGPAVIAQMSTDHGTENTLSNGRTFRYKRTNLSQSVAGTDSEGVVVRITTGSNNSVEQSTITIGTLHEYTT